MLVSFSGWNKKLLERINKHLSHNLRQYSSYMWTESLSYKDIETLFNQLYLSLVAVYIYLTAATVRFEQQAYNVREADGKVEPVLVLSNPSSSVITVQVFSTDGSATGKQLTISCTIIE